MLQNGWKPTKLLSLTSLWVLLSSSYWDSSLAALFWPAGGGGVLTHAAVSGGASKIETRWGWRHTICTRLPGRLPGGFSAATSLRLCRWVWVIHTSTVNNVCCCAILYRTVQALFTGLSKYIFTLRCTFRLKFFRSKGSINSLNVHNWLEFPEFTVSVPFRVATLWMKIN